MVIGVRSSCEILAMNSLRRSSAFSSESAILLNESISAPISSVGSSRWRTRTEKSPRANRRDAAAISSSGFAICLEYMRETIIAAAKTPMVTIAVIPVRDDQVFSMLSTTFVMNT